MSRFGLYIDEDAMDGALVTALRSREVDVLTATDLGTIGRIDEDHVAAATGRGLTLYSFNIRDYGRIHGEWIATRRTHAGIIAAAQRRFANRRASSASASSARHGNRGTDARPAGVFGQLGLTSRQTTANLVRRTRRRWRRRWCWPGIIKALLDWL